METEAPSPGGEAKEPRSKVRPIGCIVIAVLIGIAALTGGAYLMSRWDSLRGVGKAGATALVVLGSLALAPIVIAGALMLLLRGLAWKISKALSGAADQIVASGQAMYGEIHEFRAAAPGDFDGVDLSYYDNARDGLVAQGYRHLGDVVDETIEEIGGKATPIRVLASPDGTTQIGLYHFRRDAQAQTEGQREMLICDVGTELSDGSFIVTSNTEGLDLMTPPPQIVRVQHALETALDDLIASHAAERERVLGDRPGVSPVAAGTLEDVLAAEKRQQAIKNAFRRGIGFVDPDEVRRIASGMGAEEIAEPAARAADQARRRTPPAPDGP